MDFGMATTDEFLTGALDTWMYSASEALANDGSWILTIALFQNGVQMGTLCLNWNDKASKSAQFNAAQGLLRALRCDAFLMVSEVWCSTIDLAEQGGGALPRPSEDPLRTEALVGSFELSNGDGRQVVLPFSREGTDSIVFGNVLSLSSDCTVAGASDQALSLGLDSPMPAEGHLNRKKVERALQHATHCGCWFVCSQALGSFLTAPESQGRC